MNMENWGVKLVLDNEERVWKLTAEGPADMLLHYMTGIDDNVVKKLETEAAFDAIVLADESR